MTKKNEQVNEVVTSQSNPIDDHLSTLVTMSAKIRFLDASGFTRGQISKVLGIRYQWVRNVLITPLKKS